MTSPQVLTGIVKQVVSGDTVVIRDMPKNSRPNEKTLILMGIVAPKIGRIFKGVMDDKEEAYGYEAREYLRKKLIGQEVSFVKKPLPSAASGGGALSNREQGRIFFPKNKEVDIVEEMLLNGLVKVKNSIKQQQQKQSQQPSSSSSSPRNPFEASVDTAKLSELEKKAKAAKRGQWSDESKPVRIIKCLKDTELEEAVTELSEKPQQAIIEQIRASNQGFVFEVYLPSNSYYFSMQMSGIVFSQDDEVKEEAKFFIESRVLQQCNIQVVLEKSTKQFIIGSILHTKGNMAELLLKEGFGSVDNRSFSKIYGRPNTILKLKEAEQLAKKSKLRNWTNTMDEPPKESKKEFQGTVCEIFGAEALMVKVTATGEMKKVFLAGIRGPKKDQSAQLPDGAVGAGGAGGRRGANRPSIFDVEWLFEAREFLRKKLIGKKVNVVVDYTQTSRDDKLPDRLCCTVTVGNTNIGQALLQNGLATLVSYRNDEEDNMPTNYYDLQAAYEEAVKANRGLHSGEKTKHRVNDCTGDLTRAKGLFPILQRASRIEAIVEYVASGSRMRLYIPKDSSIITFLLSGIKCPRASAASNRPGNQPQGEPFGDEALAFVKEKIMQRQVEIRIEQYDKAGNMIGWLFYAGSTNLALSLVEQGLAEVHEISAQKSDYYRDLLQAQETAKQAKLNLWSIEREEHKNEDDEVEDDSSKGGGERTPKYKQVIVTEVSRDDLHIYAQSIELEQSLLELTKNLRQQMTDAPTTPYSKQNAPRKGETCAALFVDGEWYRGKVEKLMGGEKAQVLYVDYGNREVLPFSQLAPLPSSTLSQDKPFATEYAIAAVKLPPDEYLDEVQTELLRELENRMLLVNIEFYEQSLPYVSVFDPISKENIIKGCFAKGLFLVDPFTQGRKIKKLIEEYEDAQNEAKKNHRLIWEYGDIREDNAKEFGLGGTAAPPLSK